MNSQIQPDAHPLAREVLREILTRYVNDLQATPRKLVLKRLKGFPDLLEQLKRGYFVTARNVSTREDWFLPTIRTFQEVAEPKTLEIAKKATGSVLSVLQELYETSDRPAFPASEVKALVKEKTGGTLAERDIDIGLFLSVEFNYLGNYNPSPDGTTLLTIGPHESIIHFTSIEEEWKKRVALVSGPPVGGSIETDWTALSTDGFRPLGEFRIDITDDRRFSTMAIEQARKSFSEDDRVHPKVGAVVVKDGKVISTAHRGESPKCHAEYIALESKLADELVAGATVYTTLEPCTTRNHPKIPCAERLVERKVARVVIGMLDPNPEIRGLGEQLLNDANIETQLFPRDLRAQVEEMNRDFIREQRKRQEHRRGDAQGPANSVSISDTKKQTILSYKDKTVTVVSLTKFGHGTLEGYWPNNTIVEDCTSVWVILKDTISRQQHRFSLDDVHIGFDNNNNRLLLKIDR
jgi:pyrimidine deaminase RibD-like protein